MVKRKPHLDSSDSSSVESENSDLDSEFLNLAKKKKPKKTNTSRTTFSEQSASENDRQTSSESSHEEFNDGYASDFMGDAEDRSSLARMTEKEREQEIFKRIESREVLKTRFNIEKKLRQAKRREMRKLKSIQDKKVERYFNAKERKRFAEENRDKKHHSSSSSKNRRKEKNDRGGKLSSKTKLKASEIYSDDSGSSSDDNRAPKTKSKTINKVSYSNSSSDSERESRGRSSKVQHITTRNQLDQIRLSRHKLEQFLSLPFFKRVVIGCYVRLVVGVVNGKTIYKICEIADIKENDSAYQFGSYKTNKTLHLRYGPHERFIRLQYVSNKEFSDAEFKKWRDACTSQGISVPKTDQIQSKLRDIKEAILYGLKEDDIEKIIRRKERFRTNPHNYAIKKNHLMKDRELAQSIGDIARADEIQDELAELEKKTLEIEKLRAATISSINYLNSRNRKKNIEEPEKLSIEVKVNKDQKIDDPFTRRHTKPTMVHRKKDSGKEDNVSEANFADSKSERSKDSFNAIKKINPQKQGEEMYSAHDFDIKIEFDVTPQVQTTAISTEDKVVKENSSKKSLNLEDYKKRKGLI